MTKQRVYEEGLRLYQSHQYAEAIKCFLAVAKPTTEAVDESSPEVSASDALRQLMREPAERLQVKADYYVGMCYYSLRKYMQSTTYFGKVISTSSEIIEGNTELTTLAHNSYYYKGSVMHILKKHACAIKCFKQVPDSHPLAMCANLYEGFCYEQLRVMDHASAEQCFKKTLQLYDTSSSPDKDNVKIMAERALTINLLQQDKIDELVEQHKSAIDVFDGTGSTLLMYAVSHKHLPLIEKLIAMGADPLKRDEHNNSAFSTALTQDDKKTAAFLLQKKINDTTDTEEHDLSFYVRELLTSRAASAEEYSISSDDRAALRSLINEYDPSLAVDVTGCVKDVTDGVV